MSRKLIESTFVTLDGAISDPASWGSPYWDDEHQAYATMLMTPAEALVLGRRTYEGFADSWPQRSGDAYTVRINAMPKHVATRTLTDLTWNSTPLPGEAVSAVARLKAQDGGDLLKFGTGEFSRALLAARLVDEYHLWVFPVVVGSGERLLAGAERTHLRHVGSTTFESGIVVHKLSPE